MVKHKTDTKQTLFFSTMIINILYFLLVVFLIKLSGEGFSNPQLLQREYYYFYPELFEDLPPSIQSEIETDIEGSIEHNQNHWLPVTEQDFGIMGSDETETPYLMEELYLVQDDVRDIKIQLDVVKNELGVQEPETTQCMPYESGNTQLITGGLSHPCNILSDNETACDDSEYCEYDNDSCNAIQDIDCSEEYSDNGGLIRYSCPWVCQYKKDRESPRVQGGFLLTESTRL